MSSPCFNLTSTKNLKIQKALEKNKKEFDRFFKLKLPLPKVLIVNSRKDYDLFCGFKTADWMSGRSIAGRYILIFDPKVYTKETSHKNPETFWKLIKHEQCHFYYSNLIKFDNPLWLSEGLACYLANQKKKINKDNVLKVANLDKQKDKQALVYSIGYFWVKLLIESFGKDKMYKFLLEIKKENSEKNFKQAFYKIYKYKLNKIELKKLVDKYN